jgi:hypothetical protein
MRIWENNMKMGLKGVVWGGGYELCSSGSEQESVARPCEHEIHLRNPLISANYLTMDCVPFSQFVS